MWIYAWTFTFLKFTTTIHIFRFVSNKQQHFINSYLDTASCGFEPTIFCSKCGDAGHYSTPLGSKLDSESIYMYIWTSGAICKIVRILMTLSRHTHAACIPLSCHIHATFMPHLCHIYATVIPHSRNIYATFIPQLCMPHSCHIHATFKPSSCQIHATFMPHSCHIYATVMPHSCHIHATFMPHSCHIHATK
jgi:hypothetical protein